MSKHVAQDWKVVVNGVDLSSYAFNVDTPQEKDRIDVSGFGGSREFLPGVEEATLTIQFVQGFGTAAEPHAVLEPLYRTGSQFPVYVQPFRSLGTSAANPIFGGTAALYTYNGGAVALNERGEVEVEFKPAPNATFKWGTTAP